MYSGNIRTIDCDEVRALRDAVCVGDLMRVKEFVTAHGLPYTGGCNNGFGQLCDAIKLGHIDIAKFLIQKDAKLNQDFTVGNVNTPLHLAVATGSILLVQLLLAKGAFIDAVNKSKETPLHLAVENENISMVCLLLNKGACSLLDKSDFEPLHIACLRQAEKIIDLLLSHRLQSLNTALLLAVLNGNQKIVLSLLSAGANPNVILTSRLSHHKHTCFLDIGSSPLFIACEKRFVNIIDVLLNYGAEINCSRPEDNFRPLHLAAEKGFIEVVLLLLNNGADPTLLGKDHITPLHLAAENGHWEIASLLAKVADLSAKNSNHSTALHLAIEHGHMKVVNELLKQGAPVNAKDINDNSPLFLAIQSNKLSLVNCVLQYKPHIDAKVEAIFHEVDKSDEIVCRLNEYIFTLKNGGVEFDFLPTAVTEGFVNIFNDLLWRDPNPKKSGLLHSAVENGHVEILKSLLIAGCDVNSKKQGATPVSLLFCHNKSKSYIEILQILLASGADLELAPEMLHKAVDKECIEVCKFLIEIGANINMPLKYGDTPLHHTAILLEKSDETKRIEIAKLFLKSGADINCKDNYGSTTLHLAVKNGWLRLIPVLIEFGADVNVKDEDCRTPLHYAVENGSGTVVDLLLKNNAEVNACLKGGRQTPLHIAANKGHTEIVKILLDFDADVDARDSWGNTALHFAVRKFELGVVMVLLQNDCNINIQNNFVSTPLGLVVPGDWYMDDCDYIVELSEICGSDEDKDLSPVWDRYSKRRDEGIHLKIFKAIVLHFFKFKSAGMFISENTENEDLIHFMGWHQQEEYLRFERDCNCEIERLMCEKLTPNITLYDILQNHANPLFVRSVSRMRTLESFDLQRFPIYRNCIENWFRKHEAMESLLSLGKKTVRTLVGMYNKLRGKSSPNLSDEVLEKILFYLSKKDLRSLISSAENLKHVKEVSRDDFSQLKLVKKGKF